jgi:hypothetical protein
MLISPDSFSRSVARARTLINDQNLIHLHLIDEKVSLAIQSIEKNTKKKTHKEIGTDGLSFEL